MRKISAVKHEKPTNPEHPSFWEAFFQGMANIWPAKPHDYIDPTGGGFASDAEAIRGDFANIAIDMRKILKKHGQTNTDQR